MNYPVCNIMLDCSQCSKVMENVMTHYSMAKGFHFSAFRCEQNLMIFLLRGTLLINSKEYDGVTMKENQFVLQSIGSKLEMLAVTDIDLIIYRFNKPIVICEHKYNEAIQSVVLPSIATPLTYTPLTIVPPLENFLMGMVRFLDDRIMCGDMIELKQKELNVILSCYYSIGDLATLYHSISAYTTNFHYFVMQNYLRARTVEDLAQLGGYTVTTFRRIFKNLFNEPAYEWMLKRRSEAILEDLTGTNVAIADICTKYGFDSFSHFSNFCRTNLGGSPRALRKEFD